jgi:nucleotide-binding universal stress UspA family protein
MPQINRILCPVDLSDIAGRALDYAISLARQHRARLHVLEVVEALPEGATETSGIYKLPADLDRAGRGELGEFVRHTGHSDVVVDIRLRQGDVVPKVLDEAASLDADLIVLGTHGRGGFQRLTLGSVAERVLRRAGRPVLAVPPGDRHPADAPLRTILCPTDFSDPARSAAEYAMFVAAASQAELVLMTVFEWPFGETHGPDAVGELRRSLEAEAADQLTALAGSLPASGVTVRTKVASGKPSREILEVASHQAADLVVMGLSGRGAVDLALLGSTTHQVLRQAPCPVLTVPRPQ